jgi:hypothetical protein
MPGASDSDAIELLSHRDLKTLREISGHSVKTLAAHQIAPKINCQIISVILYFQMVLQIGSILYAQMSYT